MSDCPDEESGWHFWEIDGPNTVSCSCGAEGRIVEIDNDN